MSQEDMSVENTGPNLKKCIKQSKYKTQDKFADAMNADPTTVRRWIKNGIFKIDTLMQIAKLLNINFWELLAR